MRRTFAAGLAAVAVTLWVAAQPGAATAQTPTPTPAATLAPGGPGRTVTLGAWFATPDAASAPVGDVRFNVTNTSTFAHELVVIRTNLSPNALPQTAGTGRVDETGLTVVGRLGVPGSATAATSMNLTAGNYVLLCNLPRGTTNGHYASGMFTSLEVRAGGAALGNAAPLPAPTAAPAAATQATPAATAAAAAAAPAAPKTGSAGLLVSDVATGGLLALMLATVVLIVGGRVVAGRTR